MEKTIEEKALVEKAFMDCAMQIDRRSLMGLFKSDEEYRMDQLIRDIEMNMSNNYKDNAQADFAKYEKLLDEVKASGKMKEKKLAHYESLHGIYQVKLKGYTHKDQKPYWT